MDDIIMVRSGRINEFERKQRLLRLYEIFSTGNQQEQKPEVSLSDPAIIEYSGTSYTLQLF